MFLRIVSILFPLFALVAIGYVYGRRMKPDMTFANQLNMDVFMPALVFAALASKEFDVVQYQGLAWGALAVVIGSGLIAWPLARFAHAQPKTFVPPMMFNNSGNLGLPLAVLAFGEAALAPAVVMFMISNTLHFSFGAWLLDRHTRLSTIWRIPVVFAAIAGLAVSATGIELWPPLLLSIKLLGEVAIPLLLFALGVRLASSDLGDARAGVVGAVLRPLAGMVIALLFGWLFRLEPMQQAMLFIFGALPPAVLNYVMAERYRQEPEKVASIVLIGNVASVFFLPLALALVLD